MHLFGFLSETHFCDSVEIISRSQIVRNFYIYISGATLMYIHIYVCMSAFVYLCPLVKEGHFTTILTPHPKQIFEKYKQTCKMFISHYFSIDSCRNINTQEKKIKREKFYNKQLIKMPLNNKIYRSNKNQ